MKTVLDGSWTPLYYVDWQLLIILEVLTFILEFAVLWSWNQWIMEKEKRWTVQDVFIVTLTMNLVSFFVLLPVFILTAVGWII